jgi:CBS domain-containing protein
MTAQVVPVKPELAVEKIGELFAAKGISSAPVVDERGKCVGVISAVDCVFGRTAGAGRLVQDVMSRAVKLVSAREPLLKAAQVMCANHVHRLPVTDEGHRVVGVISTMDIVAAMLNAIDEADASAFAGAQP